MSKILQYLRTNPKTVSKKKMAAIFASKITAARHYRQFKDASIKNFFIAGPTYGLRPMAYAVHS